MEEPQNGNVSSVTVEEDEGPMVGPGPAPRARTKRPLQFKQAYLDSLPSANMYEKSYMHRDVVTHVAVSAQIFHNWKYSWAFEILEEKRLLELSLQSILDPTWVPLKVWLYHASDEMPSPLMLSVVQHHNRAGSEPLRGKLSQRPVSTFTRLELEMLSFKENRAPFTRTNKSLVSADGLLCFEWVYKQGDVKAKLAISDRNSSFVHVIDARPGSNEPIISREIHLGPVKVMKYNPVFYTVISADAKGIIEYWSPATLQFTESKVNFRLKSDTNLFEIVKCKTTVTTIEVSPDGKKFSITSPDHRVCFFWFRTGKLQRVYEESLELLTLGV